MEPPDIVHGISEYVLLINKDNVPVPDINHVVSAPLLVGPPVQMAAVLTKS